MMEKIGRQIEYLESIPTPITVIDTRHRIQYINQASAKMVGKDQRQCLQAKCYELFKTEICRTANCGLAQITQHHANYANETTSNANNATHPVYRTATPLYDKTSAINDGLEFIVDMTENKKLLTEIKTQGEYLASSVEKMLAAMRVFASGDLKVQLSADQADTIGTLFIGFNKLVKNFADTVSHVKEAVMAVARSGNEINNEITRLATGAQEQSSTKIA